MGFAPPTSRSDQTASSQKEVLLATLLTWIFFAIIAVSLAVPFFSRLSWTTLVQDDFFYYLVVARNLVHGHGSTFNGIVATNGYQPLWFACIVVLSLFTASSRIILGFVAVTAFAASIATFLLSARLLRKTNVRPLLVFALSAWVVATSLTLFCGGMEVTLVIPLALGVACVLSEVEWLRRSPIHAFYLGLLLAATVLSRIDTLILGAMLLAGILLSPRLRALLSGQLVAGAAVGFLPVPVYFICNRIYFHTWLPISGAAKQLKIDHHFSSLAFDNFRSELSGTVELCLVTIIIALLLLPKLIPRLNAMQRVIQSSLLIFPFVYYPVLSYLSDWPLWPWYWYAIRLSFCASLVLLCFSPVVRRLLQTSVVLCLLILGVLWQAGTHPWQRNYFDIDDAALRVRDFATTHPGIYAMGDRSGNVAYLLPYPMVQLEGLMMDRHFLELLRSQVPLKQVMDEYRVRYYVATAFDDKPCFEAVEPRLGGSHSAHMRDEFCGPPVLRFTSYGKTTLVYDLAEPK